MDEILRYLLESGKINLQEVKQELEMKNQEELLAKHKYKIWQNKSGKWFTYLPDEKKGRVQRERNSEEEIKNLIISFYREKEDNPTVEELFYEWLDRKLENQEIGKPTYSRYVTDFERCFDEFKKKRIKSIDELVIEDFLKGIVHNKKMTSKAYSNIRILMRGMFKYARKKKLVDFNIKDVIDEIDFSRNEFHKIEHEDIEQVFFVEEEEKIMSYMKEKPDLTNLGLMLILVTGLRVGELCTLKYSDIEGNIIRVNRTEIRYKDKDTGKLVYTIKDAPKTDAGKRCVVVKDEYLWILKRIREINPFGEFLFMKNGKRMENYIFRDRIYYNCKKCGIVVKSPHKARKTYGSKLYDGNVPEAVICSQMGHTDISCLKKHYYYNRYSEQEQANIINQVSGL